ncbi:hypothetical protein [uncultured Roseovarius sp.]|uniref:hypothetical protein n=1 Tax=uncultured Roseovarius sp. TaxID=293344 RepID=UPI0026088F7F|nr:hypothetical protein [uncultured Roseovarius sp.]
MAVPLSQKLAAALPYVMPVVGGLIGIAWINTTAHGNPLLGIAVGALSGWAIAYLLLKLLDRGA